MKVRVFNGFVDDAFPARHQSPGQMQTWLNRLREAVPDLLTFSGYRLKDCWAYDLVQELGVPVYSADHPNEPADRYATPEDALASQIVLSQRFEWLRIAAFAHPDVDVWAWIEPTIFKQNGITVDVIRQFVREIEARPVDCISLPGVWNKTLIEDHVNHWRFCGSAWVCPAKRAEEVSLAMKTLIALRTSFTQRLCWDNSSWSYAELLNMLPMRWYPGNHDASQFTGYLTGIGGWPLLEERA